MKKKVFMLVLCMIFLYSFVALASEDDFPWEQYTDINHYSELLPSGVKSSYATNQTGMRGETIAFASVNITNVGDGYMQIVATTAAHTYCDRIRMRIYLDKYNSSKDVWENVKSFTYDMKSEDAGGELYMLSEEETVKVQKGYYYRVRGVHTVYQNGENEGFSTYSKGVLAEDTN